MRLILVHGINQQTKSSEMLQTQWLDTLRSTAGRPAGWPQNKLSRIDTPFYGDRLFALTETPDQPAAIAQGSGQTSDEFTAFAADALTQMALRMGATQAEIEAAAAGTTVPQGSGIHQLWIKAVAKVIEKVSPLHGSLALRLLGQAHAYLKRPHIGVEVDAIVRPALESDEPAIIVSHSLGTIVTYKLLREFADAAKPRQVPLYVTLGSPLGIDVVRRSFALPRLRPAAITRWLNGADPEDFVALQGVLNAGSFGTNDIENISDIDNGDADPHAISGTHGYLRDKRIADTIAAAIDA